MRFVKRICLPIICLSAFLIGALSGCTPSNDGEDNKDDFVFDNKYNATLYDQAIDFNWFSEEYLMENLLNKCVNGNLNIYDNEIRHSDTGEIEIIESIYPTIRTNIIKTQEEFERAFVEFPDEVDFENQIIIVNFYKSHNATFALGKRVMRHYLISTTVAENELTIKIGSERVPKRKPGETPQPNATQPTRRSLIIKMDKIDFETVIVD